jgi:hypothetical protein
MRPHGPDIRALCFDAVLYHAAGVKSIAFQAPPEVIADLAITHFRELKTSSLQCSHFCASRSPSPRRFEGARRWSIC